MASGSKSRTNLVLSTYPVTVDVVAISPDRLLNVTRYECDTCNKGFVREQNLQLHGRAHNRPFTLSRNSSNTTKKVYVCPEPTCIHHDPSHAIGDLSGLKKHFFRKHVTEKNHKCDKCSKAYAAEVDLKAHSKICGKKKYKCSCGMEFQKKCDLNHHMNHSCSSRSLNGATNNLSRNEMGKNLANVTTNSYTHSFLIGSTSSYPQPLNMEHNSARIATNHNNNTLSPQIPLVQAHFSSYSNVSHYRSQFNDFEAYPGSHMTNHSMGSNSCQTLHASCFPPIQQNQQDFQNNYTEGSYMHMLMGDNVSIDNSELDNNFDGRSFYDYQESVHNTSPNAVKNDGYGGGAGSFNQDYGHGYWD